MRIVLVLLVLVFASLNTGALTAQEETYNFNPYFEDERNTGDAEIRNNWIFNVSITSSGFLFGTGKYFKVMPYTHLGLTADMIWVKGEDEFIGFFGETINSENILVFPLVLTLKRRVFANSLINTMRPFVTVGAGGVYGLFINSDLNSKPTDHERSQFAPTGLAGFGLDFGKPGETGYGLKIQYQFLRFPNHLGQRTDFSNLQIGFHLNF